MKVYFSYAYTTPARVSDTIKEHLSKLVGKENVTFYERGTEYSDDNIRNSEAFCIFLPNNSFELETTKMSSGIQKELRLAHSLGKHIILAYLSKNAGWTLYHTTIDKGVIKGIPGTNSDVVVMLQGEVEIKPGDADIPSDLDWLSTPKTRRLLL
jgi:hypothetical protein